MLLSLIMPVVKDLWNLQSHHISLMVFALYFGMLVGSLLFGWLSDRFGRRKMLIVTNTGVCAAILLQSFAINVWMLIVCLLLNGFFAGGSLPLVYSYYTEFLPVKGRGFFLTCLACSWSVGELLVSGFAWAFIDRVGFRWVIRYSVWPCIVVYMILPFALTSPRFLLKRERRVKSLAVLQKLAKINCADQHSVRQLVHDEYQQHRASLGTSGGDSSEGTLSNEDSPSSAALCPEEKFDSRIMQSTETPHSSPEEETPLKDDAHVNQTYSASLPSDKEATTFLPTGVDGNNHDDSKLFQLQQSAANDDGMSADNGIVCGSSTSHDQFRYGRIMGLFLNGYWKTTFTLWALWFLASVSLYCIQVFLPEFIDKKGITIDKYPLIFLSSLGNIPGVIAAALVIDFIGRKLSLLIFCVGCAITMIPFGFFSNFWLMLTFLVLAKFFMYGAWGILDAIVPETYPTANRSVGNACANAMARIAGMVTPFLLEDALLKFDSIWPALGMASGVIFVTGIVAMNPWLPETKGKKIE